MAKKHNFNFEGGEHLTQIGATWFVSYSFYEKRDKIHFNWKKVEHKSRISVFNRTKNYHKFWLQQVVNMDNNRLNTNKLDIDAEKTKQMARVLLNLGNSDIIGGSK